ncbi:MAG TPA: hypothetical protein VFI23_08465 [Rhizomicrobium sp.]|nr:hypothetical protein [Rhizomicrobium sp.]
MSEDFKSAAPESGEPAAVSLALAGASRIEADAYLRDQRQHLREQLDQIHLDVWEKKLGVLLRIATLCVGLAFAGGLGLMVWDAAHSKGLVITPFNVPPSLADRGLTGEVIASQMIDKLTVMSKTESSRAFQSYANNWGNNIKVEIPETGVSIGELQRFLTEWLGHDTRISGEVYKTDTGIVVAARAGGEAGAAFVGKESDLDSLVQQAAEHIYEVTQPYRYANYLDRNYDPKGLRQRIAKAASIYRQLIAGDVRLERAWAWNGLGTIEFRFHGDNGKAAWYYRKALAEKPDMAVGHYALSSRLVLLGQDEVEFQNLKQASQLLHTGDISDINPHYAVYVRTSADARVAETLGDFAAAIPISKAGAALPDDFSVLARGNFIGNGLVEMVRQHDLGAFRAWRRELGQGAMALNTVRLWYDLERQDWRDMLLTEQLSRANLARATDALTQRLRQNTFDRLRPFLAYAHAQLGDFTKAEALLADLSPDDAGGIRARALVAELKGEHARADWWFARSEAQTPSIPLTDLLWGQTLLKRGQPDAAIRKFVRANTLGPKFADPLEGWGEALMAKNQSHLALAKFAEAGKYAPNWGRLHLKWGEALIYAGNKDEGAKHFARAAQLDLTPSEKQELSGMIHG